jgi:phosphoserine phosphatase RsbU/P
MNDPILQEEVIIESINMELKKLIYPNDINDSCFSVASRIKNASYLGGDLYNQLLDRDGNYWFAIGDASGHDVNSHLFSMMILIKMNKYINTSNTPKDVSKKINYDLKQKLNTGSSMNMGSYASLAILKAEPTGKFIHYGQHPSFILHKKRTGSAEIISTLGTFIGLDVDQKFNEEEGQFFMEQGDKLYLFTDGIFEQKNEKGKFFGYLLYEFIKNNPEGHIEELADRLFANIMTFSNHKIDDDMTLMIIEKK